MEKSIFRRDYAKEIIFAIFFIIILLMHLPMTYISDDAVEAATIVNETFVENFLRRWYVNGRIITDVLANIFYRMPIIVWKIFDSLVYLVIAKLMAYLFTKNTSQDVIITCTLMLLFPFRYLSSAGYVATTTNYIYPMLCLLLVMLPFKRYLLIKQFRNTDHIVAFFSVIYISNHDQSAMVLIGGLFLGLLVSSTLHYDKILKKVLLVYFLTAICVYLLMVLVPGHINRMNNTAETMYWLPEYLQWTFGEKIYRGYTSTVANLVYGDILLFEVFCVLIFVLALIRKNYVNILISMIPIAVMIFSKQLGRDYFIRYFDYTIGMPELVPLDGTLLSSMPLVLSVMAVGSIFISVIRIIQNERRKWGLASLLLLAAGSREMMGFSGTIYASSYRTFTAFLYILIVCSLILITEIMDNTNVSEKCRDDYRD